MNSDACRRQNGVALIMAILIVAVAAIAATSMLSRQAVDIQRTSNVANGDRAWLYALGGESLAIAVLQRDKDDSEIDALNEDWATAIPFLPVEGGGLSGGLVDLQGRFNLNNLVSDGKVNELSLERFRRLLTALEIDPVIAQAVVDWIDSDLDPRGADGAEDGNYLGAENPYRAANRPMFSPTELRLVAGFDNEIVEKLLPHVSALPYNTNINVNTATIPVLMSLAEGISESDADSLIGLRDEEPWEKTNVFLASDPLAGREVKSTGLDVSSRYFLSTIHTEINQTQVTLSSQLYRGEDGKVQVLMRSRAGY